MKKYKYGELFSDLLEIHILEFCKKLDGKRSEDNWIRLFNAQSEEDLDMIRTMNPGLLEAISEVKKMSMRSWVRAHYEANQKAKRDRKAREAYVWDAGHESGCDEGREEGREEGENRMLLLIQKMNENGEGNLISELSNKSFLEKMYKKYEV